MSIKTGNGDRNEVLLEKATLTNGKLTVTTGIGSGQKVILTGGSVAYDVSIKTGNGNDNVVQLDQAALTNGKLTVTTGTGSGQKVILTGGSVAYDVSIKTGNGNLNEGARSGDLDQRQADRDDRHRKRPKIPLRTGALPGTSGFRPEREMTTYGCRA